MPEAQAQEPQPEVVKSEEQQQQEQADGRSYTASEWKAREDDFSRKADKIRKNAARDAELKLRREMDARQPQPQQQQRQEDPDPEPKREEFDDHETFSRALSRWEGRQGYRAEATKAAKEAEARAQQEQADKSTAAFRERAKKAMDEIHDFAEVVEDAHDVMITKTMGEEMEDSPMGPRILYELAKDPDEALRISKLPLKEQRREIIKMESRFEAEAAARKAKEPKEDKDTEGDDQDAGAKQEDQDEEAEGEEREQPERDTNSGRFQAKPEQKETRRKAPEPIEPVAGRGGNNNATPSDKDSDQAWLEKRNAEIARERQGLRRRAG